MAYSNILAWGDVTLGSTIVLIIFILIGGRFIFHTLLGWDDETQQKINKISETCFSACETDLCKTTVDKYRGGGYYLETQNTKTNRHCFFNIWELSHIITHIFIGYFYNIYYSQALSIGFELYEWKRSNCGSWFDLGYNFFGFLIGHTLKNIC